MPRNSYHYAEDKLLVKFQKYTGDVIKEVLHDDKVNVEGLNFLDRMFRHP